MQNNDNDKKVNEQKHRLATLAKKSKLADANVEQHAEIVSSKFLMCTPRLCASFFRTVVLFINMRVVSGEKLFHTL